MGTQSPRPPPAAWLESGRREVKAAVLGWGDEVVPPCLPLARAPRAPQFSGLPCLGLTAPLIGVYRAAGGTALPAPALNLDLVAEHMIPTRFPAMEGDNQASSPWLGHSLLQGSSWVETSPPFCKQGWCHQVPKALTMRCVCHIHLYKCIAVLMPAILVPLTPRSPCLSHIWHSGAKSLLRGPAVGSAFETKSTYVYLPLPLP